MTSILLYYTRNNRKIDIQQKIMLVQWNFTVWKPFPWSFMFINLYFDATIIWRVVQACFTLFYWRAKFDVSSLLSQCLKYTLEFLQQIQIRIPTFYLWKPFSWSFMLSNSYFDATIIWRGVHVRFTLIFDAQNLTSFCGKYHESMMYSDYHSGKTYGNQFFVNARHFHDIC